MSALLTSLPARHPGLVQRCTPVELFGFKGIALGPVDDEGKLVVVYAGREDEVDARDVVVDLTDPTGRAHAARWAYHHPAVQGYTGLTHDEHMAMETALHFDPMTPTQIDTLARLALRLAGRE